MVGLAARCGPGRGARCLRLQVRSGRVSVRVYYVRLYVRMAFSETQTTLRTAPHTHDTTDLTSLISEHLQVFGRNGHPYSMAPERNVEPCSSAEASHETTWIPPTPSVRAPCAGSSACADDGGDVWASRDVL